MEFARISKWLEEKNKQSFDRARSPEVLLAFGLFKITSKNLGKLNSKD